jgi:hypothetical protein
MAARPWVTPQEVRDYSEIKEIQERTDARLKVDISRAEKYVITLTHNSFEAFEEIPEDVKTAVCILAEAYGQRAIQSAKSVKSETFDDYSYTAESSTISIDDLDLAALLDEFVINEPRNGVTMRMRRL